MISLSKMFLSTLLPFLSEVIMGWVISFCCWHCPSSCYIVEAPQNNRHLSYDTYKTQAITVLQMSLSLQMIQQKIQMLIESNGFFLTDTCVEIYKHKYINTYRHKMHRNNKGAQKHTHTITCRRNTQIHTKKLKHICFLYSVCLIVLDLGEILTISLTYLTIIV